jgi:ATP-dependent Lon protease
MATTLVSALCKIPVRKDVAMTGEITLRGRVLPIGGLKEKVLAAHRGGIKRVVIPKENAKDIREIPKKVRERLQMITVEDADDVLREALVLEHPEAFLRKPAEVGPAQPPAEAAAQA